jgi:hypothetical protein
MGEVLMEVHTDGRRLHLPCDDRELEHQESKQRQRQAEGNGPVPLAATDATRHALKSRRLDRCVHSSYRI